jgi:serine protease SohB
MEQAGDETGIFSQFFMFRPHQMIASQASQILAAPFAIVGSIGVIMENLNFFEALKNHGVKTINLKAGDMKNPVSRFGEVTDKDLKLKQKDLEDAHRDFIELCRSSRPDLDPEVCNGRVLSGEKALETGMLDRILTSEEYIYEKISDGDLVMKIHLVSPYSEQLRFARILQILPHFQHKMRSALSLLSGGRFSGFSELRYAKFNIDTNTFNNIATGVALASMIQNAIQRSQFGKKKG